MANAAAKLTAVKIMPRISFVTNQLEMPMGQYHMENTSDGIGTNPSLSAKYVIVGNTSAIIHIGTINMGFHAIVPNTTGSLILRTLGTTDARPNALSLLDCEMMSNNTNGSVAPRPPKLKKAVVASAVNGYCALSPAVTASVFAVIANRVNTAKWE